MGADDAEQLGLITRAVDDESLGAESARVAAELASASTSALAKCRALLWEGATASLTDQLAIEARSIGEAAATADGREGVEAFLARRPASFGRA